jgi:hypothetical protein
MLYIFFLNFKRGSVSGLGRILLSVPSLLIPLSCYMALCHFGIFSLLSA